MAPFTTFFCTLYHHTHEKTRLLVKVVPERSPPTSTSFDTNSGTLLHEERGHRLSSHRSSLAQRRGVLAEQADFGERALRDFCGTYVRRCVDMGGAGDRASFGQAEVHTHNELRGVLVCFLRGGHAQNAIPRRACLFCNWRRFDDV